MGIIDVGIDILDVFIPYLIYFTISYILNIISQ